MTPYRVRILPAAENDITQAHAHFVETAGVAVADEWETRLFAALRELATTPRRQVAERESRLLGQQVRRLAARAVGPGTVREPEQRPDRGRGTEPD
jgi:plasmid stabilization system protein ParE